MLRDCRGVQETLLVGECRGDFWTVAVVSAYVETKIRETGQTCSERPGDELRAYFASAASPLGGDV